LYAAAEGGYEDVVEVLLAAGAEVGFTKGNPKGWTALKVAGVRGHQRVVELLREAERKVGEEGQAMSLAVGVGVRVKGERPGNGEYQW
jgi:ankyrin repeat protein